MNKTWKINFVVIFRMAKTEFIKLITDARMIIVAMLMVVMANLIIEPLMERAQKYGAPINALEPFIALANSGIFTMFIPAVFIILISDFPDMSARTLYSVQRAGRLNWLLGQIGAIIMLIISYIASLLIFSSVYTLPYNFFGTDWSDSVTKYISKFPDDHDGLIDEYLSSRLYNQMSLGRAVLDIIMTLAMYLLVLALILILFRILSMRAGGIFACFMTVALGVVTLAADLTTMWYFPMAHTIVWIHYTEILKEPIFPMYKTYLYLGAFILVLLIINIFTMKKININSSGEE